MMLFQGSLHNLCRARLSQARLCEAEVLHKWLRTKAKFVFIADPNTVTFQISSLLSVPFSMQTEMKLIEVLKKKHEQNPRSKYKTLSFFCKVYFLNSKQQINHLFFVRGKTEIED